MAFPLPWGERVRVRGDTDLLTTPTLILPHQEGGKFFLRNWIPRSSAAGYFINEMATSLLNGGKIINYSCLAPNTTKGLIMGS